MPLPIQPSRGIGKTLEAALNRSRLKKEAESLDKQIMDAVSKMMAEQGLDPQALAEKEYYIQALQQVMGPEAYSPEEFAEIGQQMQANYERMRQQEASAKGSVPTMEGFEVV